MPANRLNYIFIGLFLWPCLLFSQSQIELLSYLSNLEESHAVNFNYLNEDIKTLKITKVEANESLDSKLKIISLQIPIGFEFLDDSNIVVRPLKRYYCLQFFTKEPNFFPLQDVYVSSNDKIIGKTYINGTLILNELPDNSIIKAYRDGFEILDIDTTVLNPEICQNYFFQQKINLDEVQLSGYLTRGLNLNKDLSLTLKPTDFEILPGLTQPDVLQTMQLLPGVISLDETISNINVRGGTHDQNLFLWNGARLYQTGHFFGMISALNPSIAHNVNIYKNGSSAFYTEGLSSVVDISSTENFDDENNFEFFANFLETTARADVKFNDNAKLRVAGRYALSNIVSTPAFDSYFDKIFQNTEITSLENNSETALSSEVDLNYFDTNIQYKTKIDNSTDWQVNLLAISNNLEFLEEDLSTLEQKNNSLTQETYVASTQVNKVFSNSISGTATAYASYYNLDGENALIQTEQLLRQKNEIQDYGLKLRSDINFSNKTRLSLGYQFNEVGIRNNNEVTNPDVILRQKSVVQTHSGIIEWRGNLFNELLLSNIGLRTNVYDKFSGTFFEPHINLTYRWSPFLRTSFMAEQKHQITAQVIDLQSDFFGVENRRWVLADQSQIPIQRLRQIELGQIFNKKTWLLTANIFFKQVEGISSSAQNFQNQLEFLQISGNYSTYGLELFAQKQISNFKFWSSLSYNESNYEFQSINPSVFPNNFETSFQMQSGISYVALPYKLSMSARYFSGRPTTLVNVSNPILNPITNPEINFLSPNSSNITSYSQVNFTGSYTTKFNGITTEVGLSILNLFNSGDITNQFFRLNNDVLEVEQVNNRSLDFTPNVFLKLNF